MRRRKYNAFQVCLQRRHLGAVVSAMRSMRHLSQKGDEDGAFIVLRGASAHNDHSGGLVGRLEAQLACGFLSSTA